MWEGGRVGTKTFKACCKKQSVTVAVMTVLFLLPKIV